MKVAVNFIYGYQKPSGEKYKTNEKRISSIGLTSLEMQWCHCEKSEDSKIIYRFYLTNNQIKKRRIEEKPLFALLLQQQRRNPGD